MPPRNWVSPPTRREITLLTFALTLFILSYNLETSLRIVGVGPEKLSSSYLSSFGLGKDPGFDRDGRRPAAWRDKLENLIVGEWEWSEGDIAGVEHAQDNFELGGLRGTGKPSSYIYNPTGGRGTSRSATRVAIGVGVNKGVTVKEQFLRWGSEIPETVALVHVPGYTILENVFILNGTLFVVRDDPETLPPIGAIASSTTDHTLPPRRQDWRNVTREEAQTLLGSHGGRIHGTTWLTTDPAELQDPYTLFSLFRTQSSLLEPPSSRTFISHTGLRIITPGGVPGLEPVPPPIRFMLPSIPTFSSPHVDPPPGSDDKAHPPMRTKAYNGLHPSLLHAVFPTLGISYTEDWKDFAQMEVPYLLDRIIIADSGAAERGRQNWTSGWTPPKSTKAEHGPELRRRELVARADEVDDSLPIWAAPFEGLRAPEGWWLPARAALLSYLQLPPDSSSGDSGAKGKKKSKGSDAPVLTYVSMQDEPAGAGPRLNSDAHDALVQGLHNLQTEGALSEVHIVRGNGTSEVWDDRMKAIARSGIMLGTFGPHMADSVFMPAPLPVPSRPTEGDQDSPNSGATQRPRVPPILMEFFPAGMFRRDQEYAVRSLGMRYIAWWNDRKFAGNSLPPAIGLTNARTPKLDDWQITLDVNAVLESIRDEAIRWRLV